MTRYLRRLMSFAFFALLSIPIFAEEVNFIKDNVRLAIDRAATEGKLVFLDFWADYCSPCQLMEKYTFTDATVIDRMNSSYVPVRINIETFEGYDLKTQYKVSLLPTIIVLDSKGKQVARFEESMSASKLNGILAKYDIKKNRKKFEKPKPEPVKVGLAPEFEIVAKPTSATLVNSKPTVKPNNLPAKPVDKPAPVYTAPVVANPRPIKDNAPVVANPRPIKDNAPVVAIPRPIKENVPISANNAPKPSVFGTTQPRTTNNMAVKPTKSAIIPTDYATETATRPIAAAENPVAVNVNNATTPTATKPSGATTESFTRGNFTIQVGNFANKDNATRVSAAMKMQLEGKQKVFLLSGGSETLITHRVMVGGFKTHKEATEFKKQNQINGFVQAYSNFLK